VHEHALRVLVRAGADLVRIALALGDDFLRLELGGTGQLAFLDQERGLLLGAGKLVRFAWRISSGTATRSWSIRLSTPSRSTITLLVRGMLRPVEISRSSCSRRKTISMGMASVGLGEF